MSPIKPGFIKLSFNVSRVLPDRLTGQLPVNVVARVYLPEDLTLLPTVPTVITCLVGGSYDWRYFDVQIEGHENYSQARYMAAQGHIVVIPDHIGIGDSSRVANPWEATRHWVATANHEAMRQLYQLLERGELCPELPALPHFNKVGLGHSMGGMQTITQQALLQTYDAVGILGYTAQGVHLSFGGQLISADPGPISQEEPDYWLLDRSQTRETFHWEDVPQAVLQADDSLLVEVPTVLSKQSITGGIVTGDAKKIAVPVYICLGQRDVSPDPYMEPYFYKQAPEVTLHILPKSGHCQSFASTRMQMWDRINGWIGSIF
jgi:pimeloyl-ACP methyl ester carboxylesterase